MPGNEVSLAKSDKEDVRISIRVVYCDILVTITPMECPVHEKKIKCINLIVFNSDKHSNIAPLQTAWVIVFVEPFIFTKLHVRACMSNFLSISL